MGNSVAAKLDIILSLDIAPSEKIRRIVSFYEGCETDDRFLLVATLSAEIFSRAERINIAALLVSSSSDGNASLSA